MFSSQPNMQSHRDHLPKDGHENGASVCAQASSQHPYDWGRALASAVSQLIEQIIDVTGVDPCNDPLGVNLSLNIRAIPGGEAITATWLPGQTPMGAEGLPTVGLTPSL